LGSSSARVVDLPGVYSLVPYTPEEKLTETFLHREKPDLILNVIDATRLERSLYLTTQLLELGIPVIAALSMTDALARRGGKINCSLLSALLGVPVIPICATRSQGTEALLKAAFHAMDSPRPPAWHNRLSSGGRDPDLDAAQSRYRRIHAIASKTASTGAGQHTATERIDRIATNRYLSIPLFFLIIMAVFAVTFGTVGQALVSAMGCLLTSVTQMLGALLKSAGVSLWIQGLVLNGILSGVGAVLKFLPQIALLFLLLSFLEDSG
jgi:ferrous iron transport protein B